VPNRPLDGLLNRPRRLLDGLLNRPLRLLDGLLNLLVEISRLKQSSEDEI
jgi:hypothetical protein